MFVKIIFCIRKEYFHEIVSMPFHTTQFQQEGESKCGKVKRVLSAVI